MDRGLYLAASGMLAEQVRQDQIANDLANASTDLQPLFDLIIGYLPGPAVEPGEPTQFQCNNLDYNEYVGRLGIGRLKHGSLEAANTYMLCTPTGAAWCAASPASQTPPFPKLRARRRSNRPRVDQ